MRRTNFTTCYLPFLAVATAVHLLAIRDAGAQPAGANYEESKVPHYTLPDPLITLDGERVADADTWHATRRPELLVLFQEHVYGTMPPATKFERVDATETAADALSGIAMLKQITLHFHKDRSGPQINLLMMIPKLSKNNRPFPAFLGYNFRGNHTVHADEKIRKNKVWGYRAGSEPQWPDDSTRGASASRWQVEKITSRGYALVTLYYGDVDPDFDDGFKNGVHALYPEYQNRADNWASIGAWAWGLSRVLDYLESEESIDANRVALVGHSRLGKTSLWAGANDERFAMVVSNNSGCGGAALARRRFGETVARINSSFPHWFCTNHKKYNNNEDAMPVDHHQLVALIAPRPAYVASAVEDQWADPHGEFLSCVGADPVYRLLGIEGLPAKKWPAVNQPVHGGIGYHVRAGKHDVTEFDWQQYLDFADQHLRAEK